MFYEFPPRHFDRIVYFYTLYLFDDSILKLKYIKKSKKNQKTYENKTFLKKKIKEGPNMKKKRKHINP